MAKKALFFVLAGALFAPGLVFTQEGTKKVDSDIFSIHAGLVAGYSLNAGATTVGRSVGINFTVSDNLKIGFLSIDGQAGLDDFALMDMAYFITDAIGLEILFGTHGAAVASGVDAFFSIGKPTAAKLRTTLKMNVGYLFDAANGIENGTLSAGLQATVGL